MGPLGRDDCTWIVALRYIEDYERITHKTSMSYKPQWNLSNFKVTRYSRCVHNSQTTNIILICQLIICRLLVITFCSTMEESTCPMIDSISLHFLTKS